MKCLGYVLPEIRRYRDHGAYPPPVGAGGFVLTHPLVGVAVSRERPGVGPEVPSFAGWRLPVRSPAWRGCSNALTAHAAPQCGKGTAADVSKVDT